MKLRQMRDRLQLIAIQHGNDDDVLIAISKPKDITDIIADVTDVEYVGDDFGNPMVLITGD